MMENKMTNQKRLEEYLVGTNGYLKSDISNSKVIMLSGKWGSGKTHFWKNKIEENLKKEKIPNNYISLYGKTSIQEIKNEVFLKIFEGMDIFKIDDKSVNLAKNTANLIADFTKTVSVFGVNLDLSKINTPFDIIKLKNDFLGETNKVYLKSVFETNCFKIKELYRLYVAYDKELNKELNYKIDQKILDKTLYVKNVYDLTSIVLEDYSLSTHEWNFLFEELNTNLNLNKIKESKEKIEEIFDITCNSFAYPFGFFDKDSIKIVEEISYSNATTTVNGVFDKTKYSNFEIPRIMVSGRQGLFSFILKMKKGRNR